MKRRYLLPITVYAALLSSAPAATVTLTDAWQNLGTGPFILQTQGGDGMFEASAAAPTDNGLAVGKNQVPFAYPSTLSIWGKRRAQARNNAGAPVDTTVVVTPMTLAGGGSGAAYTGPAAAQAGSSSTTAMPVQRADGKAPLTAGETIVANQGGAPWAVSWTNQTVGITGTVQLGASSAAIGSVSVSNFPTTQQVAGTVTANIGTTNGLALDSSSQAIKTALGSPFQAGGSIGNTAFGSNQGTPAAIASAWPVLTYAPNAAVNGRTITKTALAASTNATVCPPATGPLQATEIQASVANVGLGFNGQTLSAASPGTATSNPDLIIPTSNGYYKFEVPPTNAITAYSANAGVVTCIQTARQ